MEKKFIVFFISILFTLTNAFSQSLERFVISTSGGFQNTSIGSLSITIGESFIPTLRNTNSILTQGFQQIDTSIFTLINTVSDNAGLIIFPNPTTSELFCNWNGNTDLHFSFYNDNGSLIEIKNYKIESENVIFNVSSLSQGLYFLQITDFNNKNIYKTKFIKQ